MWTSHVNIHTGDDFCEMILQMSPASKFPKVEKEQALLKQMIEYRDEEIPGMIRKKQFEQMVWRMCWICSWICRRWKGEKTHLMTSPVDRFPINFASLGVGNCPKITQDFRNFGWNMIELYQIHLETWWFQVKKKVLKGHVDLDHHGKIWVAHSTIRTGVKMSLKWVFFARNQIRMEGTELNHGRNLSKQKGTLERGTKIAHLICRIAWRMRCRAKSCWADHTSLHQKTQVLDFPSDCRYCHYQLQEGKIFIHFGLPQNAWGNSKR